jgi:hypothetical protein
MMDNDVERLIDSAAQHGRDSEPDHEVGDLQDFLRLAWSLMTDEQCSRLMAQASIWE